MPQKTTRRYLGVGARGEGRAQPEQRVGQREVVEAGGPGEEDGGEGVGWRAEVGEERKP